LLPISRNCVTKGSPVNIDAPRFFLKKLSLSGMAGVLILAVMGLLGYLPGWRTLGSIHSDYIPMAPATALSFMIFVLLLLISTFRPPEKRTFRVLCLLIAGYTALFGLLETQEYFTGIDLSLEERLFIVSGTLNGIPIGRMSPATGFGFLLSGASILFILLRQKGSMRWSHPAALLGSLTFLTGFIFTLSYFYGQPLMYGQGSTVPMALTTALGFILLGFVLTATAGADVFPLNMLTGPSTRAHLLRFILPISVLSVIVSGWTVLVAAGETLVNPALVAALLTVALAVLAGVLATWASHHIGEQIDQDNIAIEKASDALRKSSERFERAIMDAPFPAMIYARGEEVLLINRAWSEQSGYPMEDIYRITDWRLKAYGSLNTPVCDIIEHLYEEGSPRHKGEIPIRTFNGKIRLWDLYFSPLGLDDHGRPLILEMAIDITERKEMERRITQLARFPADNPNPVMRFSSDGEILYANDASRLLMQQLKQVDGKILPGNFDRSFTELLKSGEVYRQEINCGDITYTLALAPLSEESLINLYALDISERKKTERRLAKTLDELSTSNRDLEQFAYIASHDLQEPLRMIANYVQLLERRYKDKLDQDAKDFIGYAVDGAVRMQQLIDSLLDYSRLQTRKKPFVTVDLEKVAQRVLRDLEVRILETGARITIDPLPQVYGDAVQLGLVIQNFVSNALKFRGKKNPEVYISAKETSSHWKIMIRDNGIGIEPEHQERIFKIFQRLHSRAEYPGTGIGLAICRRIMERHGGETGVESALEKGSTFWFTLPKKGEK
jgi:PAS domain S-box-containing protein